MISTYFMNSTLAKYNDADFAWLQTNVLGAGVFADSTGNTLHMAVAQSGTPGMSVQVAIGKALVQITKLTKTFKVIVDSDAISTVAIASNATGANRVDAIVVRVNVTTEPNILKSNVGTIEVVLGTGVSALSDAAITTALGADGWYRLANVTVANGAVSILNASIADVRAKITTNNAIGISDNVRNFSYYDSETDQTQATQNSTYAVGEANATTKKNLIGQKFVAGKTGIRGVKLYKASDTGSFTGTVKIALQADSSGSPSGADLTAFTITNAVWLKLVAGEFTIQFPTQYATVIGTSYWIVVVTSTSDNSNHPNFGINTAGGYASGALKFQNVTDGWTLTATSMLYFKTLEKTLQQSIQTDGTYGLVPVAVRAYSMIDFNVAAVSGNSTTPTVVYSKLLEGGLFNVLSGIKLKTIFVTGGATTSGNGIAKVKLNGTQIFAATIYGISWDKTISGVLDFMIVGNNSLSAQNYSFAICAALSATGGTNASASTGVGTSAIDLSQPVLLEITFETTANTIGFNHQSTLLEKIA